jgi:hypothetical protein
VVVAAAVVLGFVLLGGADGLPIIGDSPRPPTPEFAFKMTKITPVATSSESKHDDLATKAQEAAAQVGEQMNALYVGAFIDPDNWLDGSYDALWDLFDEGASAEAQLQVDTLTAGTEAGEAFEQILPASGVLKTKVLFDLQDEAYSVVAVTRFEAVGSGKDGGDVRMTSKGQFVFQQVDGDWRVVSFKVLRDNEVQAPSPSAGATPTESPS